MLLPTWRLSGITCAFTEPSRIKTHWAFEANKLIREYRTHLSDLKLQSRRPALLKLTRQRLEGVIEQVELCIQQFESLLAPLEWRQIPEPAGAAYFAESPQPSRLAAAYGNLFRDWVWGETENQEACERIAGVAGTAAWSRLLVLGSGGSRLAYDLHRTKKAQKTVACDYNPLLLLTAERVISGKSVSLTEFPLMPKSAAHGALQQTLKAPEAASPGFEFCLADASRPAFQPGSFDTVVTPWLIDVIETSLPDFLAVINQILPTGGSWINFGPLGFNDPALAAHYSLEEVRYLAGKSGFKIVSESYEMIPYMHNPSGNSHRLERVLTLRAEKVKDVEVPATIHNRKQPQWLIDKDLPVDFPAAEMGLAQAHLLNAEILALVQNGASFNDITGALAPKYGLSPEQASYLAGHILSQAEALARRNPLRR